jgi:hypothetical protein
MEAHCPGFSSDLTKGPIFWSELHRNHREGEQEIDQPWLIPEKGEGKIRRREMDAISTPTSRKSEWVVSLNRVVFLEF